MALRTLPSRIHAPPSRLSALPSEGGAYAGHYHTKAHKEWAEAVKRRDHFTCLECGAKGGKVRLIADHIVEVTDGGDLLDVANGRTMCLACHNRKTAGARAERNAR